MRPAETTALLAAFCFLGCATSEAPKPPSTSSPEVSYSVATGACENPKRDPQALAARSLAEIYRPDRAPNAQVLRVRCAVRGETVELITGRAHVMNHDTQWIVEGRGYYSSLRSGGPAPTPAGGVGPRASSSGECGFHLYDDATGDIIGYGHGRCATLSQEAPRR